MGDSGSVSEVPAAPGTVDELVALYDDHIGDVYSFLMRRCGANRSLAEDITQETFTAAAKHFQLTAEVVGAGWLYSVSRRRLIDHWRSEERRERKLRLLLGGRREEEADSDMADAVVDGTVVAEVLGELPAPQRAAFVLRFLDGYSTREVAELIGRSVKATESLVARARQNLASSYREHDRG